MVAEDGLALEPFMAGQSSTGHCPLPAHSQQAVTPCMGQALAEAARHLPSMLGWGPPRSETPRKLQPQSERAEGSWQEERSKVCDLSGKRFKVIPLCIEVGWCIFVSWLAACWLLLCLLQGRWLLLTPSVSAPPAWPLFPSAEDQGSRLQLLPVIVSLCL